MLVLKRIHVRYSLQAGETARAAAERAHSLHAPHCPVYRSISGCIRVTTELAVNPTG